MKPRCDDPCAGVVFPHPPIPQHSSHCKANQYKKRSHNVRNENRTSNTAQRLAKGESMSGHPPAQLMPMMFHTKLNQKTKKYKQKPTSYTMIRHPRSIISRDDICEASKSFIPSVSLDWAWKANMIWHTARSAESRTNMNTGESQSFNEGSVSASAAKARTRTFRVALNITYHPKGRSSTFKQG